VEALPAVEELTDMCPAAMQHTTVPTGAPWMLAKTHGMAAAPNSCLVNIFAGERLLAAALEGRPRECCVQQKGRGRLQFVFGS
jgi:hypothetical protein